MCHKYDFTEGKNKVSRRGRDLRRLVCDEDLSENGCLRGKRSKGRTGESGEVRGGDDGNGNVRKDKPAS